jgi:hypothetical protein
MVTSPKNRFVKSNSNRILVILMLHKAFESFTAIPGQFGRFLDGY